MSTIDDMHYPYEIHITVGQVDPLRFKKDCSKIGVKPLLIARHTETNQLFDMQTSSTVGTDESGAFNRAKTICSKLHGLGYNVIRTKIETVPWHHYAPTLADPCPLQGQYFETHIHIQNSNLERLSKIAASHDAHMSHSVFKYNEGDPVYIMTLRTFKVEEYHATKVLNLIKTIKDNSALISKVENEFVVYDSNINHDKEWTNAALKV